MSCSIVYNNGELVKITDSEGRESSLFNEINALPFIKDVDSAVDMYNTAKTNDINDQTSLSFEVKGEHFTTYSEAVKQAEGSDISVKAFSEILATVSSNRNTSTKEGLINHLIAEDLVSDKKVYENGESYFQPFGFSEGMQVVSAELTRKEIKARNLGKYDIQVSGTDLFTINELTNADSMDFTSVKNKEGATEAVSQFVRGALSEVMATTALRPTKVSTLTEGDLRGHLTQLLSDMGVELMSIEAYNKKVGQLTGNEIEPEALADISRQIIAFSNREIGIEALTEEAVHFIVEALPAAEVEAALPLVINSIEYSQEADKYRKIYASQNPKMSPGEVETLTRKEILGKIVSNRLRGESQNSVFDNIIESIQNLLNKISTYISGKALYTNKLNDIYNSIEDLILTKNIDKHINTTQFENKKFTLYRTQGGTNTGNLDRAMALITNLTDSLTRQEALLTKSGNGSSHTKNTLNNISEELQYANVNKSLAEVLQIIVKKINYIQEAMQNANIDNKMLSSEESSVLAELTTTTRKLLSQMTENASKVEELKMLLPEVEEVNRRINRLEGFTNSTSNNIIDRLIDRILDRNPALGDRKEEIRAELREAIEKAQKDTNVLYSYYGQITHAQDPILNLLGTVIADMHNDVERTYVNRAKNFMASLRDLKITPKQLQEFVTGDGYFKSMWNFSEYAKDRRKMEIQAHNEILASSQRPLAEEADLEEFFSGNREKLKDEFKLNEVERFRYQKRLTELTKGMQERAFKDEYYEEREEIYDRLETNVSTQIQLRDISAIRGDLIRRSRKDGKIKMSHQVVQEFTELTRKRKMMKSHLGMDGEIKDGLEFLEEIDYNNLLLSEQIGYTKSGKGYIKLKDAPSLEAIYSYDMNRLDNDFKERQGQGTAQNFNFTDIADNFLEEIEDMESDPNVTREQVRDFFLLNTSIGFNDNFWDNFGTGGNTRSAADSYIREGRATDEFKESFSLYKFALDKRNNLVKLYQDSKNSSNIDVASMNSNIKEEIRSLSETISDMSNNLFNEEEFKKYYNDQKDDSFDDSFLENTPNESYYGALRDEGIGSNDYSKILTFALKNMTRVNATLVGSVKLDIENFVQNGRALSSKTVNALDRTFGEGTAEMMQRGDGYSILKSFAESKLDVYYKALAPEGTNQVMRELWDSNQRPISEVIQDLRDNPSIVLSNHYSYYDSATNLDNVNENYIEGFEGGTFQPSVERYGNKEFIAKFGLSISNGEVVASKSNAEYETYKTLMNFQRTSYKAYNVLGKNNLYKLPQISKTSMDKMMSIVKGKGVGRLLLDEIQSFKRFRVDELEQGEEKNGEPLINSGITTIPRPYLNDLEIAENLSNDVLYSIMAMAQQSELYKGRVERFSDVLALQESVMQRGNIAGKASESTNTYKMFKNYMDANFFGVNETFNKKVTLPLIGDVDIANVFKSFHSIIRWKNLAFNAVIPLTSMITANVQTAIEKNVGQYIDKGSYKLAVKEFNKNAMSTIKETLAVDTKSKLGVLGQYMGIYNLEETFKDSIYAKSMRFFGNASYGLHTMANFEPLTKAMLSSLLGHRIYNGNFLDYKGFSDTLSKEGKTAAEIKAKWLTVADKSFYHYLDVIDGGLNINYVKMRADMENTMSPEDFRELVYNFENGIRNKTKKFIERIDGNIRGEERTALQRNFLGRYVMTHKAWMSIGLSNRFKLRHFNTQTIQYEEGTYVSVAKTFSKAFGSALKNKSFKSITEEFNNLDETDKMNLRRVGIELSIGSIIFLIGAMATSLANDDDNKDLYTAQFMAYMAERMANETSSNQIGVFEEIFKTVKEPVVGIKNITDFFQIQDAFSSDEVKRGTYKGMTKAGAYWTKNFAPTKQIYLLSGAENLYKQRQSYQHFNDPNAWQPMSLLVDKELFDELLK